MLTIGKKSFPAPSPRTVGRAAFALALILRLAFILQWHALPYGDAPMWDAQGFDEGALKIAAGQWLQPTAFYISPLYTYVLGLIYAICGHSFLAASVINALLDSATCAILALIAFEAFGAGAAIFTGLLAGFDRSMIFYTAPTMKESLGLFLLTGFVLEAMRALKNGRPRDFGWGGFWLGACALVRGNALLLLPVMWLLAFRQNGKKAIRNLALFTLTMFGAIAPATLHNAIASRDFVLINYNDGFNFYLGNAAWSTGIQYDFPPFLRADARPEEAIETDMAEKATGEKNMKPSQVSHYWRGQAFAYILHHPAHSLALLGMKFRAFWNGAQQYDNYDIPFIARNFSTVISLPLVGLGMITTLAAFGAVGAWRARRDEAARLLALAAVYMASVLLFYVTERYRLPIIIFLLPLAGASVPAAARMLEEKDYRRLGAACAGAAAMIALALWPRPSADMNAYDWGALGGIEADNGHYENALRLIEKGMAISPANVGADGMIKASFAAEQLGRTVDAMRWLTMAEQLYPDSGAVAYNIGRLQAAQGKWDEALAAFRQAIKTEPTYPLSYYGEALVLEKTGRRDEALAAVKSGLAIAPGDARLLDALRQMEK